MTTIDLATLALAAYFWIVVITRTDFLVTFVPWLRKYKSRSNLAHYLRRSPSFGGKLVSCGYCCGFWISVALVAIWYCEPVLVNISAVCGAANLINDKMARG